MQFSLRTLLIGVTALAVYAGFFHASATLGAQAIICTAAAFLPLYCGAKLWGWAGKWSKPNRPAVVIVLALGFILLAVSVEVILAAGAVILWMIGPSLFP